MFKRLNETHAFAPGAKVLDVGCGQGVGLEVFAAAGLDAIGITLGPDVAACRAKGLNVVEMDLSFLDFEDARFDLVWCRHALEHSVFPFFTLSEMHRVLKPGGVLYVEVPAPDTACAHQTNPNHYSVLGKSMWIELIRRTGFAEIAAADLNFSTGVGPDTYWAFITKKPG
jgi:ubiquinone/menaquinone biosynthesis C-methylase UbiE